MLNLDYYEEWKWCRHCKAQVHYLRGMEHSFCVECGGEVVSSTVPRVLNRVDASAALLNMRKAARPRGTAVARRAAAQ